MKFHKDLLKLFFKTIRIEDSRRLFWSVYYPPNFGDWIGPYLYIKITGLEPWFDLPNSYSLKTVFMSAGSILSCASENCIVWGSGMLFRNISFPKPHRITAVRGPYTRQRCLELNYDCPEIYGDPGILLPLFYKPQPSIKRFELGIIPHKRDYDFVKNNDKISLNENILVIDVRLPIEQVIDQILSCNYVVSSSLHGLIVSHAYHIPAGWVSFGNKVGGDNTKFYDHYAAFGHLNVECLKDAIQFEIPELINWAKSAPVINVEDRSDALLAACPFPIANKNIDC